MPYLLIFLIEIEYLDSTDKTRRMSREFGATVQVETSIIMPKCSREHPSPCMDESLGFCRYWDHNEARANGEFITINQTCYEHNVSRHVCDPDGCNERKCVAIGEHLRVLQWARESSQLGNDPAAQNSHFDVLQWARDSGTP